MAVGQAIAIEYVESLHRIPIVEIRVLSEVFPLIGMEVLLFRIFIIGFLKQYGNRL